jgi:hypothetical protein
LSEYQYYEFLAVDRPLDEQAQAQVRSLSTRARITATSFVNEYHWGDFRSNPSTMMEHYYDAHLYLANWGTRHVILRLPRSLIDLDVAEQYCVGNEVTAWTTDKHLVLSLTSEAEEESWDYEPQGSLAAIVGVRGEIAAGDHRALYLAWLAGYGTWERDEADFDDEDNDEPEPPVPAGLRTLTAPQRALADFLRLDDDLLTVAAETSPPLGKATADPKRLAAWVAKLPTAERTGCLYVSPRTMPRPSIRSCCAGFVTTPLRPSLIGRAVPWPISWTARLVSTRNGSAVRPCNAPRNKSAANMLGPLPASSDWTNWPS